jgi:hypothetical protein
MTALFYNGLQAKSDKSGVIFRIGNDGNVYAEDSDISGGVIKKHSGISMTTLVASNFGTVGTERLIEHADSSDGKYIRSGFYKNGWTAKVKMVDDRGIYKVIRVS